MLRSARVEQMSVGELHELRQKGAALRLLDVRTPGERQTAMIADSELFDGSTASEIGSLPRDTPLVFYCHTGRRSQAAAEHFARLGFSRVYNLAGGIDAWSLEVDPSVPRY